MVAPFFPLVLPSPAHTVVAVSPTGSLLDNPVHAPTMISYQLVGKASPGADSFPGSSAGPCQTLPQAPASQSSFAAGTLLCSHAALLQWILCLHLGAASVGAPALQCPLGPCQHRPPPKSATEVWPLCGEGQALVSNNLGLSAFSLMS